MKADDPSSVIPYLSLHIYYILPIMSCNLIVACLIEMDNKLKSIVSPRPTHLPGPWMTLYYILPILSREQLYARIYAPRGRFQGPRRKMSFYI